jgi:hypothetical protein
LDVTTSHNRGTLLFWLQSRPSTLAALVVEGAGYRCYKWIKGGISPPDTLGASKISMVLLTCIFTHSDDDNDDPTMFTAAFDDPDDLYEHFWCFLSSRLRA